MNPIMSTSWCVMMALAFQRKSCRASLNLFLPRKKLDAGLAISHSILERHNGSIEVQSEVGRGTTFNVTLPWDAESEKIAASLANEIAASAGGR